MKFFVSCIVLLHLANALSVTPKDDSLLQLDPLTSELLTKYNEDQTQLKTTVSSLESLAQTFITKLDEVSSVEGFGLANINWKYSTNITDHNKQQLLEAEQKSAKSAKERHTMIKEFGDSWKHFQDKNLSRIFDLWNTLGYDILPADKFEQYSTKSREMSSIYSTAKICDFKNATKCDLTLNPDLYKILATSRDYEELQHVWTSWRDASGKKMKTLFTDTVQLMSEAAQLNGFKDLAEQWNDDYEDPNFENEVASLFEELQPLYSQLHAYTRRKLREVYGEEKISKRGPIPAHLLGNMWAQSFNNIYDILIPFANETSVDVTDAMKAQNYTVKKMFESADNFFASLGLLKVNEQFWTNSILERPEGREMVCHASAWDFRNKQDFRIKQCTQINMEDFFTVHHEMGHIQYFMQYKDLPLAFRRGANLGFHEAVGDLMSLSVSTPKHLEKVGLLTNYTRNEKSELNFLMLSALDAVSFLPFGYLVDKWRWDVFRGLVTPDNYTCSWWDYRYKYQGVKAPVNRTSDDFDPGAKYHVAGHSEYIEYFVSRILTFQFYESACKLAGEFEPGNPEKQLHNCDIYQSKEAGMALQNMLKLGKSQHWRKTLQEMTGIQYMTVQPLLNYFQPLLDFLKEDNMKNAEFIGWEGENDFCSSKPTEEPQASTPVEPQELII